ncbi:MAG: ATP synthase F1 subunit gamma [Clostridiales bacterium]|nr:ATP synthase F1 subunit gamma [Clostridiales bacterium]
MDHDILHRMKSIRQTVQISNAQKLVAAAQIGKARKLLRDTEAYHSKVSRTIADILRHCPEVASDYLEPGRNGGKRRGVLLLSANKGLAGGFNSNIIHFAEASLAKDPAHYMIVLGKARPHFIQKGFPVDPLYEKPLDPPTMFTAREIAEKIGEMMDNDQIDSFDIIHTKYRSSVKLDVVQRRLFPLDPAAFAEEFDEESDKGHYTFEPSPDHVLHFVISKYLKGYLYGCLIHTWLCELTARVTAMDSAIRNGNEMLGKLSLVYNRARQASITQEITEIVAGAAAMAEE